ncbi:MAG: hypothetical protein IJ777_04130 [Clostridia bacterium]|nr:hypothetical protein [Clostridia bacterium]
MEQKIKYQYTYFIYPYVIEEKNYQAYLYNLLKKENCKLKIFEPKKDIGITSYFLPEVKDKMFWTLDLKREGIREYHKMDKKVKAAVLSQKPCNIFDYELKNAIQGKMENQEGIFFSIEKIQMICFQTGVCFLALKTTINSSDCFSELLNFNYKFRDIYSKLSHTKEYDNIKIQAEQFKDMKEVSDLMREIVGPNTLAKQINLDTNRFLTYSYVCLDQTYWNENTPKEEITGLFQKYKMVQPAEEQSNDGFKENNHDYEEKYIKYGFSSTSTVLLTTDMNIKNYTTLPFDYENKYFYHYIFNVYKKIYLKKISYEFNHKRNFYFVKDKFLDFSRKDWIIEVTNDDIGKILEQKFSGQQELEETFFKLKNKYDILYKDYEIEKHEKHNEWIVLVVLSLLIICIFVLVGFFRGNP